jgi:hypothetical protein
MTNLLLPPEYIQDVLVLNPWCSLRLVCRISSEKLIAVRFRDYPDSTWLLANKMDMHVLYDTVELTLGEMQQKVRETVMF